MKKNGWIVIIVTLIALLLPAAGIQIALHGKTVPLDKGRQETVLDGTQGGAEGNGAQADTAGTGTQGGAEGNGAQTDASADGTADRMPENQSQVQEAGADQKDAGKENTPEEPTPAPVTEEQKAYYLSLEAACSDTLSDGTEMRLLATDRACGSSYYTLIGVKDGECTFVNTDPFNGSGGEALFITFPDQETEQRKQTGYAGLAYSGGSMGSFYITEDGGRHFQELEISGPQSPLSDDTTYCPFIMPEEVYEENGTIYLVMGQGPDGDYHDETGYPSGLYRAEDGRTFRYVKSIYRERTED